MLRCQWFVFSLLFCFGFCLLIELSSTPNLVAQEYVPQEYVPIEGQFYEYPSQQYYPEQIYPLQPQYELPQYQPPLYGDFPQNDYRIVPGVLLSEKVVPQIDQEAFNKTTEELKLLEKELGDLENDYDTLLAAKQKLSSELAANQVEMQERTAAAKKRIDEMIQATEKALAQKKELKSKLAKVNKQNTVLAKSLIEAEKLAIDLKKQTSKLSNEKSSLTKKFKNESAVGKQAQDKLQDKNNELEKQVTALKKTNGNLKKRARLLVKESESDKVKLGAMKSDLKEVFEEQKKLEKAYFKLTEQAAETERRLSESKKQNNALLTEVKDLRKKPAEFARQMSSLTANLDKFKSESNSLLAKNDKMSQKYKSLLAKNDTLSQQHKSLTTKNARLSSRVKELMKDSESSAEKIGKLMRRPELLERQLKETRGHIDQLKKSNKVYKEAHKSLDDQYDSLQSKNKTLNSRFDELSKENESLEQKLQERKLAFEAIKQQNAEFAEKLSSMNDKPTELAFENGRLNSIISSMKDQNKTMVESNENLNKRVVELAAESKELRDTNRSLTAEISKLKAEVKASAPSPSNDSSSNHSLELDAGVMESPAVNLAAGLDNIKAGLVAGGNATDSENKGSSIGFAASNITNTKKIAEPTADSNAAAEAIDVTNQTKPAQRNLPALYGLVALILALLCSAFAWSIRS